MALVRELTAGTAVSYDGTYVTSNRTRVAVIDAGYADGFSRLLSNRGAVLIGGRRCPVIGRVTMNLTIVDLGPNGQAREGDEVVLMGTQSNESIWGDEMAAARDTIAYEVLTNIRTADRRIVG